MSILPALVRAYDRLPDAPPFGFSMEKIGFCISLNADGSVAHVIDLRDKTGRKPQPRQMLVPASVKRASGIAPNTFWDKTSYVLGVTAGDGKRTADEHAAFVSHHLHLLEGVEDVGVKALAAFLKHWTPDHFQAPDWCEDLKDLNAIFAFEEDRRNSVFLHDRTVSKDLLSKFQQAGQGEARVCLVTGEHGATARLHRSIKGVWGAQSSGASLVSFNLDAFTSYGHEQGDNAPVSERAAFAYTTVLNRYLEKDSGHRIQIGDASTVFWADASSLEAAETAEAIFASFWESAEDGDPGEQSPKAEEVKAAEQTRTKSVRALLERIRQGKRLCELDTELDEDVRFFVLGLAPNAARLSVRFYYENTFGNLTRNYQRFLSDMDIAPPPRDGYPPLWQYLNETAVLRKRDNVAPNLAGEWMRAILSGTRYPQTLLSAVLMRFRADGDVNALRVGILKAVLIRNFKMEVPMALNPDYPDRGYQLGRLFAAYEQVQIAALGSKVNATIKDKFYGSASAQPRKVFALLDSGSVNHLSKIGKQSPGRKVNLEKLISQIMDQMAPDQDPFPAYLAAEEQALFSLGYYHQRSEFFKKPDDTAPAVENGE
ncbi:type I-C CRISPR-associated protein Cas8c/Csd1 [Roseibium sp. RKSG952]|uniref:type I-C CRISPR-associated protein Cas8c/Csd1 n=1 Tax=Roseibium sp. RKSG952 TaxID=2529384 RepID=UPI0012BD42A2|nr:type I-C CRISPR-associated protein Cas8c/Csd1 [Roseibium sp. RKSG952]MTH96123.1 type I-C CRISPR-associated protein Cas8c/Csd1 [Roseibium sp. RKSG952]